jgi:hypothetical protein
MEIKIKINIKLAHYNFISIFLNREIDVGNYG